MYFVLSCFNSDYKMMLYSVHDTSVVALLVALGIFDNKWPGFAADLAFELYKDKVIMSYTKHSLIIIDATNLLGCCAITVNIP